MKYLIKIAYNGANYCGWQVQKNGVSVQGEMCRAAKEIFGDGVKVTGCSRTDSGVHAREYFCTLETLSSAPVIPENQLPRALNRYLSEDITVFSAKAVDKSFHARYDVKEKTYEYVFDNGEQRDPFLFGRAWHIPKRLDEAKMNAAAKCFIGEYDFSAFMASGSSVTDTVRHVTGAEVTREGDKVIFRVTANGFLYNMVRIMAGTLRDVSIGKLAVGDIKSIILGGDRKKAGLTAPPDGLYLIKVVY
ncbi:MAG: tRNA pseudouridine(38-40) synthase TruA [Clostridia bacterium]|nr:tRNA pseudouridine(38-40) synthase TruA [Clostridia bacterium]